MTALATLPGVDILATGTWALSTGEATFTTDDLENAIDAATCPSVGNPVIKLGHVDPRFDGEPALGRVANMHLTAEGNKITADLTGMPEWLGDTMTSAYPNRSIEGQRNFVCQQGHKHPFVITGLALLGVVMPGVGVLNDISDVAALYEVAAAQKPKGSGDKWEVVMAKVYAAGVDVEDVRRAYTQTAGYQYWITGMQLDPLQLIVCNDDDQLYRVPVTIGSDGLVTFGDPVPVQVEYTDVPAKTATAAGSAVRNRAHTPAEAGAIIRRSIRRGAIPANRADHYAARALAGEDIGWLDVLAAGLPGAEDPDEFLHLFPPQPGQEQEWEASRLAAAGPRTDDELSPAEWRGLFGARA